MMTDGWRLRARLIAQRFWQPTSACMTCMPGSLLNLASLPHWTTALHTGLATGALVLLLSFTPARAVFRNRFGNAGAVALLTAGGDAWSHPGRFAIAWGEALLTGLVAGLLALAASYVFEDRARRVRALWACRQR